MEALAELKLRLGRQQALDHETGTEASSAQL